MKKLINSVIAGSLLLSATACGVAPTSQYNMLSSGVTPSNTTFNSFSLADKLNIVDLSKGTATISPFTSELVLVSAMGNGDTTSTLSVGATGEAKKSVTRKPAAVTNDIKVDNQFKSLQLDNFLNAKREEATTYIKSNGVKKVVRRGPALALGAQETFWLQDLRGGINNPKNVQQSFTLKKITDHAYFFVDDEDSKGITLNGKQLHVSDTYIEKMTQYWEKTAYPTGAKYFGGISASSIDDDQHFYFFLSSKLGTQVLGYFSPMDLLGKPTSNNHKILYINDLFACEETGAKYENTISSTLIHEFQHFQNFDHKVFQPATTGHQNDIAPEELWLNEGLSTLAEQLGGFGTAASEMNSVGMVQSFLEKNPAAPLVTKKYDKFQYGEAYLFALYLYEQYGKEKLINALYGKYTGMKNVENATGKPFADVFKNWGMALCFDDISSVPEYNYQSIQLHGTYLNHKFDGLKYTEVTSYPFNNSATVDNWSFSAYKFGGGDGSSKLSVNLKTSGKLLATGIEIK